MRYLISGALVVALAGCAGQNFGFLQKPGGNRGAPEQDARLAPVTESSPFIGGIEVPYEDARTVEEYDTTTPELRAAALETPEAGEGGRLGATIGSLGDPTEPGFWVKTPLVSEPVAGRVLYTGSGRTVQVQLLPSGGAPGSGSQVSLAAMRLLDAPLAGLPELEIFNN